MATHTSQPVGVVVTFPTQRRSAINVLQLQIRVAFHSGLYMEAIGASYLKPGTYRLHPIYLYPRRQAIIVLARAQQATSRWMSAQVGMEATFWVAATAPVHQNCIRTANAQLSVYLTALNFSLSLGVSMVTRMVMVMAHVCVIQTAYVVIARRQTLWRSS